MPLLEAFVFFSVALCRMNVLSFEKKREACGPSPIGDTIKKIGVRDESKSEKCTVSVNPTFRGWGSNAIDALKCVR